MADAAPPLSTAIIGAGMAGLAAADQLAAMGLSVTLFDKGRGPGGRMSTRRMTDDSGIERQFDHGAQYFTARDPRFVAQVERWSAAGTIAKWDAAAQASQSAMWIGVPGMNAPVKAMAAARDVHWATRIAAIARKADGWHLSSEAGAQYGPFATVIIAIPAEQVAQLIADHHAGFAKQADAINSAPCWTVMLGFAEALQTQTLSVRSHGPIGWAARNNSKPGRADTENWVIQASADWSNTHLEEDKDAVITPLQDALAAALGLPDLPQPVLAAAHRWRYAMVPPVERSDTPYLWDSDLRLGLCGDWLSGPRVENAWLSGHVLGATVGG